MGRGYRGKGRRGNDETVTINDVYCKHETDKALLLAVPGHEDMWIPKSQIDTASEVQDDLANSEGVLVITKWIAEQKGLVEEDDPDAATAFDNYTDGIPF